MQLPALTIPPSTAALSDFTCFPPQSYVDGLGTPNHKPDERRVDLRRVRDNDRALPYHVAHRNGHAAAAELLDPRVDLEMALDMCRETSAGIGPQKVRVFINK